MVDLDYQHEQISISDEMSAHKLSLISAFEQVTIINKDKLDDDVALDNLHESSEGHHHHSHSFGQSEQAQRNRLSFFY